MRSIAPACIGATDDRTRIIGDHFVHFDPMTTATKRKNGMSKRQDKILKARGGKKPKMADLADRHDLYQRSVQSVDDEVVFIDERFRELRGRDLVLLREDFCGTAQMACAWVNASDTHQAIGVDIDPEVLDWGRSHNIAPMADGARSRIRLIQDDVFTVQSEPVDAVVAMNFSYWLFQKRSKLLAYFKSLRTALADDGLLFLDAYGGYEAHQVIEEERECDGFTYIWDQDQFDPVTHEMHCLIHFEFPDGSKMRNTFTYVWRLWSLPELKDILLEAGFKDVQIWWEGADEEGDGNGEFELVERGEPDAGWIAYLIGVK